MKPHPDLTSDLIIQQIQDALAKDAHIDGVGRKATPEERADAAEAMTRAMTDHLTRVRTRCVACDADCALVETAPCACGGFVCPECQRLEEDGVCDHDAIAHLGAIASEADDDDDDDPPTPRPLPGTRSLVMSGKAASGETAKVYLIYGSGDGELEITLNDGRVWTTRIDLNEIALITAHQVRPDLLKLYMDEMILNAKASFV